MKRKIRFVTHGRRADVGEFKVYRILPNRHVDAVGPFVFLDHVPPLMHSPDEPLKIVNGSGAHPHRGIATLTYILNGEADHFDSAGHHAIVHSGGAQWMKAGNGIIHDEVVNVDSQTANLLTHVFQFWINLPARNKAEPPEYLPVQSNEIPQKILSDERGSLKVIAGKYEDLVSRIPSYSEQFLYHIHLNSGKQFSLSSKSEFEYAAFLPLNNVVINDTEYKKGEFLLFDNQEGSIEINNNLKDAVEIILFGGEPYREPIVAEGPFVMNTQNEISQAYNDFYQGKYGKISYRR